MMNGVLRSAVALGAALACVLGVAACSSSRPDSSREAAGTLDASTSNALDDGGLFSGASSGEAGIDDGGAIGDALVLPDTFVPTDMGGYALGPAITGSGSQQTIVQNGSGSS